MSRQGEEKPKASGNGFGNWFDLNIITTTGSVECWDGKLFCEWIGYGISGRMLGGLWDGQPRALESGGSGWDLGGSWKEGPVCA